MLVIIASVVFLCMGFVYGYYFRTVMDKLQYLMSKFKSRREATPHSPTSSLLEPPLTREEQLQREHEELMERLNPDA